MTPLEGYWSWDEVVGMGYFKLRDEAVALTKTFSGSNAERINVDYDYAGNVVGVEVFG